LLEGENGLPLAFSEVTAKEGGLSVSVMGGGMMMGGGEIPLDSLVASTGRGLLTAVGVSPLLVLLGSSSVYRTVPDSISLLMKRSNR
jgi:hypothetical protein